MIVRTFRLTILICVVPPPQLRPLCLIYGIKRGRSTDGAHQLKKAKGNDNSGDSPHSAGAVAGPTTGGRGNDTGTNDPKTKASHTSHFIAKNMAQTRRKGSAGRS